MGWRFRTVRTLPRPRKEISRHLTFPRSTKQEKIAFVYRVRYVAGDNTALRITLGFMTLHFIGPSRRINEHTPICRTPQEGKKLVERANYDVQMSSQTQNTVPLSFVGRTSSSIVETPTLEVNFKKWG